MRSAPPKPWRELPLQNVRHNVTNKQPEWHSRMRREVWQHLGEETNKGYLGRTPHGSPLGRVDASRPVLWAAAVWLAALGDEVHEILDHSLFFLSAPVRWVRRRRLTAGGLPHPDFRFMSTTNDWQPGRTLTMVGWVNGRRGRGGSRGSEQGGRQHHKDPCLSDPPHPQTAYQVTRPPKPASSQLDWLHPTPTPPPGAAEGCYAHSGVSVNCHT